MKKLKEFGGWISFAVMLCVWIVTILWYGKKIDSNTSTLEAVDAELKEVHKTVTGQSNWNTRVGTIIEIQTGIPINIEP